MLRRAPALRHAGVVFIRKTATRARRDGGSYTSFRLVESVRSGSQVSQRTLLNLGSGFAVPPERWPELVLLVESLRSGQACLLEPDPALLGEAERNAGHRKKFANNEETGYGKDGPREPWKTVQVSTLPKTQ